MQGVILTISPFSREHVPSSIYRQLFQQLGLHAFTKRHRPFDQSNVSQHLTDRAMLSQVGTFVTSMVVEQLQATLISPPTSRIDPCAALQPTGSHPSTLRLDTIEIRTLQLSPAPRVNLASHVGPRNFREIMLGTSALTP